MYINDNLYERSSSIFRIVPFYRLLDIISNSKLTFTKTRLWDDPYENFLFNQEVFTDKGPINFSTFRESIAGSCWTILNETDFGWRVYAPNKDGAQIESKIDQIHDEISKSLNGKGDLRVGMVQYMTRDEIKDRYESFEYLTTGLYVLEFTGVFSLFIKRKEFEHEKEFRLVIYYPELQDGRDKISIQIDINKLIKSIRFDPRIDEDKYLLFKKIIKDLGYTGNIEKSQLYNPPKMKINLKGSLDNIYPN